MKKSPKLSIKIITLFPKFIKAFVENFGIVRKAVKGGLLNIQAINLRDFGLDTRGTVDGRPYGGGVGMVLRADVLYKAIMGAKGKGLRAKSRVILMTPQGKKFDQQMAQRLSKVDNLIFVCGRYEGFDERIRQFADEEISIGDYVLMGGELPALAISEAVMRLRPGILGKDESSHSESFSGIVEMYGRQFPQTLEYPQYTKPKVFKFKDAKFKIKKLRVPKVLLAGHHKNISDFRLKESLKRTKKRRPDLLK